MTYEEDKNTYFLGKEILIMAKSVICNLDTATTTDAVEVLTAISVVSRRLAKNLMTHNRAKKGGNSRVKNERIRNCGHRATKYCR